MACAQGVTLSYAELDARANQLAHRLIALGVGPEVPVGVMMDRSLDLVVALLGVLKAGGAYVPMDPSYPPGRLAMMMEDSEVCAFTSGCLCGWLGCLKPGVWVRAVRDGLKVCCVCVAGARPTQPDGSALDGGRANRGASAAGAAPSCYRC